MTIQVKFWIKWAAQVALIFIPLLGFTQIRTADLKYLRIGDVELSNDTLFLWLSIRPKLETSELDTTRGTYHKHVLSSGEKVKYMIADIINTKLVKKKVLATLADGQYQVAPSRKYEVYFGTGWESWEKKEGAIERIDLPLVILNGREVHIDKINHKKIKTIRVINPQQAELLYGSKGKNGLLVVTK